MKKLEIFKYEGNNIAFDFGNGQKMINATHIGKAFGKLPSQFLRLDSTKSFILALERKSNVQKSHITQKGNSERAGTWMHEKLALKYAAWLDVRFELWIYDKIEELLTTGSTSIKSTEEQLLNPDFIIKLATSLKEEQQKRLTAETRLEAEQEINKLQEKEIAKQAPKADYYDKVLQSTGTLTTTQVAATLDISAKKLNKLLEGLGVQYKQSKTWILKHPYKGKGYAKTKSFPFYNSRDELDSRQQLVWTETGRKFIFEKVTPLLNSNPQNSK